MSNYRKALVALGAALAVAGTALADGQLDPTELVQIALAFLGAIGVYAAPNTTKE